MPFSLEPPSSTDGMSGESQLSFSGGGSVTSVGNNVDTCTDTSPGRTIVLGENSGENKMSTTSTASVPNDEIDLSAPSSLDKIDLDVLRQILAYAQPPDHLFRFEWSGSVGRTCKIFHRDLGRGQ